MQKAKKKISQAVLELLMNQAFWAHLALKLTASAIQDYSCHTMWTDGKTLGYNPNFVQKLSLNKIIFLLAHEILHCVLGHHLRRGDRDLQTWNEACDYVVNLLLVDSGFEPLEGSLISSRFRNMDAEQVYEILNLEEKQANNSCLPDDDRDGDNNSQQLDDQDDKAGQSPDQNPDESDNDQNKSGDSDQSENQNCSEQSGDPEDDQNNDDGSGQSGGQDKGEPMSMSQDNPNSEQPDKSGPEFIGEVRDYPETSSAERAESARDWTIAVAHAKQYNKAKQQILPPAIERLVNEILDPRPDWKQILGQFLNEICREDYDWSVPDRTYIHEGIYVPGLYNQTPSEIVVAFDTSCSITKNEIIRQASDLSGILEEYSTTIHVLYIDDRLRGTQKFTRNDLPLEFKPKGGGCTDFRPAFEWVEENNVLPVCLVYLTDLECTDYPDEPPPYPVIWVTAQQEQVWIDYVPFGTVIQI